MTEFAEGEFGGEGHGLEECMAEGTAGEVRGDALGLIGCEGRGVVERDEMGEL